MYNIYQLYLLNKKELPFNISRNSWGNLSISVDKIDNIRFSANAWYCDAYTLSEKYNDVGYGKVGEYKIIGCAGCYQFRFSDNAIEYDETLLPEIKKRHDRGLYFQKAGKEYKCFYCKKTIIKGQEYERYRVRSAGKSEMQIDEVFCVGHRDEMRELYFKKSIDKIDFEDLIKTWNKKIII